MKMRGGNTGTVATVLHFFCTSTTIYTERAQAAKRVVFPDEKVGGQKAASNDYGGGEAHPSSPVEIGVTGKASEAGGSSSDHDGDKWPAQPRDPEEELDAIGLGDSCTASPTKRGELPDTSTRGEVGEPDSGELADSC